MKTAHFLVEIGTEELPPRALQSLSTALRDGLVAGLAERQLRHGTVKAYATPRRLAVSIERLQLRGADRAIETFGPPVAQARKDDGSWTRAATGFAGRHGLKPEQLETADSDKGPRLVYRNSSRGAQARACLPAILEDSIGKLPIPRRMRWGASRTEFARPVHWLLMLLGADVIDCEILGLAADRLTHGHRFHSTGPLSIARPADYLATLTQARVIADFAERRATIRAQLETEAERLSARVVIDDALLDEVTALVEWPVALTGQFEQRFLQVPAEALIAAMKVHQKYFHLLDTAGALLPYFITVANIESTDPAKIIEGNERVIRPRLSDAAFFYDSDRKQTLASRVAQLKGIVFQQQLGSLHDKSTRLVALAGALAERIGANAEHARRAALLCKTDLLTLMVGEFANMQGIAGRYYALHDGEPAPVATALEQQYWPRFAGDALPDHPVATALALADRLDTLIGIFGIGQAPSGSRDPFSLRRAALGVLRILLAGEHDLDLRDWLTRSAEHYPAGSLQTDVVERVLAYMIDRFRAWYEDEAIPVEVFKAVVVKRLATPLDIHRRVLAVHAFSALPQAGALAAANKRVSHLLDKQGSEFKDCGVNEALLQDRAEQQLARQLKQQQATTATLLAATQYAEALAGLADLQPAVDLFFDEVMVMVDEEALRNNRLSLLKSLRDLFLQVADISQLVVPK